MNTHGFTLVREAALREAGGIVRLWRHDATGAELLSAVNDDENKCFGVTFRTPPADSTGVAHILEHSVLCGSEKYPVKEPFVELLKGSLQTFLNAFTFPDKTCYPVASCNTQDFYNLIDVYLDAVFHPRITPSVLQQEGWHVEAPTADGPWSFKGVVYNEMKGVYSSPDSVLAEQSQHAVFPDTLYSVDSGGDPEVIPSLTFEAFKNFHSTYYHPSNARFFFWGDDPEEKRLEILASVLAGYDKITVSSDVPLQPRRDLPREIEATYASTEEENRAMFTVNWLLCESTDVTRALMFEMLEHILEGLPGSPLRKALIESGLGEDTTGCGLETDLRQLYYSVGLKGVAPRDVHAAEMLIYETLGALADEGIPREAVDAAVNSVEFDLRENNSGRFPRGLAAMLHSLTTWLYDGDPFAPLAWEQPLADIKARLARGEKLFEQAIREWLLDNSHRALVTLLPDGTLAARREADEQRRLDRIQAACTAEERAQVVRLAAELQEAQGRPDSAEALASIPCLGVSDLPRTGKPLPCRTAGTEDEPLLLHELDTSGVLYGSLLLPLDAVPARLLPLVPLLSRCLTEVGTARRDYVALGTRIASRTGGISAAPLFGTRKDSRAPFAYLALSGKAVGDRTGDLFDLFHEILHEPLADLAAVRDRMRQMLLESKARLEQGLLASGHSAVGSRLRARFSVAGWLTEATGGISQLHAVRTLLARVDDDFDGLLADLAALRACVLRRGGALFDTTGTAELCAAAQDQATALLRSLPDIPAAAARDWLPPALPAAEAFIAPSQINYVGKGANLYDLGYRYHGSASVILRYLRMGYLWEKVRVQGGAYGAFCTLDRMSGTLVQTSYRDPAVSGTLAAYDSMADFLRTFTPDERALTNAIVGAIGDMDAYLMPDAKGAQALARHLTGEDEAAQQQMRDEILGVTAQDFRAFADVLAAAREHAAISIIGGSTAEQTARDAGWHVEPLL